MSNNLHAPRWTDDPAQREEILTKVGSRIDSQSKSMARRYRVGMNREDIKSEIQVELLRQMNEPDTDGPFAKDTPEEAAAFLLANENYEIRELARSHARKEAKTQSRQSEIMDDVRQPDLPPDVLTELSVVVNSLPRIFSETPDLTAREWEILLLETLRLSMVDDLPASELDQFAQAAGTSGPKLRAHVEGHDKQRCLSPRDRKALSRARAKVKKAVTKAKLKSFLAIVFALSLPLLNATHQGRSSHQKALVNQGSFTHQNALAHQGNLIDHQNALAHQENLSHQNALAHQISLVATNRHQNG